MVAVHAISSSRCSGPTKCSLRTTNSNPRTDVSSPSSTGIGKYSFTYPSGACKQHTASNHSWTYPLGAFISLLIPVNALDYFVPRANNQITPAIQGNPTSDVLFIVPRKPLILHHAAPLWSLHSSCEIIQATHSLFSQGCQYRSIFIRVDFLSLPLVSFLN